MANNTVSTCAQTQEKHHESTPADPGGRNEKGGELSSSQNLAGWSLRAVIASLALGMFLVGVDASVIGVAIPRITETFHSLDDISWYGSAYMLPCTVLQPSFGWFYKIFNVTYVYLVSVVLFEGMLLNTFCTDTLFIALSRFCALCCSTKFDLFHNRTRNIRLWRCWDIPRCALDCWHYCA